MINRLIRKVGYGLAMRMSAFLILSLLAIAIVTVKARRPPGRIALTGAQMAKPLRDLPFLAPAIGLACMGLGVYVPVDYLPVEGIAFGGISQDLSQYIVGIFNTGR
jgi:MFS transporter, MCT family, aspergillic acid transporter